SLVPVLTTLTRFNEVISELLANNSKFRIFLALLSGAGAGGAMRIMAEDAAERVTKIASAADVLSAVSKKGYGEALDKRLAMNEDAFNKMAAGSSDIAAMEKVSKELAEAKAAKRWEEAGALFKQLELLKQLVALDKETPARGYTERERNQM